MPATTGKGISPEWANLPRRKCANCGNAYKPIRPLRPHEKYGFCTRKCNKQFYKYGAAFIQLRPAITKEAEKLRRDLEKRLREIVREELRAYIKEIDAAASGELVRDIVREELQRATVYDGESRACTVIPYIPPLTQEDLDALSTRMREAKRASR
jgi:hypothetical protein